jgi:hypothetical protein
MSKRDYYWVNADVAAEAGRRMGLAAFGCMGTICALAYTRDTFLPADDDTAAAELIHCPLDEWKDIKARLIASGDIEVREDLIVPAATWARPEFDG